MMVKGLNSNQIGKIIRFALDQGIFWVSFYPHSRIVRNDSIEGVEESETHVSDLLDEIERETEGRIRPRDFVDSVRWLDRAFGGLGLFDDLPRVDRWEATLSARPSIQRSLLPGMEAKFLGFLQQSPVYRGRMG